MRISACVITKNEEKNLPKWLDSMHQAADEIIVVDTGSADGTVAIAESAGAKVFCFPWIDDFSAAKNFAIGKATGDWILFLDADQYFADGDALKARETIQRYHEDAEIVGLAFCVLNLDTDTGRTTLLTQV